VARFETRRYPLRAMNVNCKNCRYFKQAPYQAPHTGCYHPDNMAVKQKERYLDQQQLPGDHRKLNLRGDCALFEALPERPSLLKRLLAG
jgi:hypothetical protein